MSSPILAALNPAQQQAVQIVDGPVLVLAGPGSGKTRLLTHRVAYLIDEIGVDPVHILAVTFTNRAAREMRERLDQLIGPAHTAALTVGTFHSLCARFLRRDIVHLERERDFAIYDAADQEQLVRRVMKDQGMDEKKVAPRAVKASISNAKNELIGPADYGRYYFGLFHEQVARCYEAYQQRLRDSNALDFDDLLLSTVRLFETQPDVLATYHERYLYLLVDEYQDTNRAQYILVRQLAAHKRNLFVVGDPDQSIYAWRGADIRNILQFEDDYPDARVVLLEQNYRSTQAILDIAQAVISGGSQRKHDKQLWTDNGSGARVVLLEGYDQNAEAQQVADEIMRLHVTEGYRMGDFAVMYRTNAQSRVVEEALVARQLNYQIVGGVRFYERKEVKDVLAYLRLINNPADNVSLERIINTPKRAIGPRTVADLQGWASQLGVSLYQALQELQSANHSALQSPFSNATRKKLLGFLELIDSLIARKHHTPLPDLIDSLLDRLKLSEVLQQEYDADEAKERWANIEELRAGAAEYVNIPLEEQLMAFLEGLALFAEVDTLGKQSDAITCITLHQAKGLEFPVVFLVGLEEGLLPHSHSQSEPDKLEEERRLFYVGATRAQERLYLLYAFKRASYGRSDVARPSRFLADIPRGMLEQPGKRLFSATARNSFGSLGSMAAPQSTPPGQEQAAGGTLRFAPGQRVIHGTFGEGVVMTSKLIEGDEEVIVHFAAKGEKKLLASFARLKLL